MRIKEYFNYVSTVWSKYCVLYNIKMEKALEIF